MRSTKVIHVVSCHAEGEVGDVAGGMNRMLKEGYKPVKPLPEMGCGSCE